MPDICGLGGRASGVPADTVHMAGMKAHLNKEWHETHSYVSGLGMVLNESQ